MILALYLWRFRSTIVLISPAGGARPARGEGNTCPSQGMLHMASDNLREAAGPRRGYYSLVIRLGILAAVLAAAAWLRRPDGNLHLIFPEVPGDAILIQSPHGEYTLIDGGADPAMLANLLGQRLPFWRRSLAGIVLTIPDSRHLPGQIAAFQRYRVGFALAHPAVRRGRGAAITEWRRLLGQQQIPVRTLAPGRSINLDGATLRVLAQDKDGVLLRIDYGRTSVVLAQSSNPTIEARAAPMPQRRVDLLAFPWQRDPYAALVEELRPRAIIFTDGHQEDRPAQLTYLDRMIGGAAIYHEQNDGAVEWISDGQRSWVVTER
jgi:hypothetical protein